MRLALALFLACSAFAGNAEWDDVLRRAHDEKKPILIVYGPPGCARCEELERVSVPHPAIQRRLPAVVFATMPGAREEVVLYDRAGARRASWAFIPGTMNLAILLDSVARVADHLECAVVLDGDAGELEAAKALARLGFIKEARAMLERLSRSADAPAREAALGFLAPNTPPRAVAPAATLRILPFDRQLVRTHVASSNIARVAFELDGRALARVDRPPFSTRADFGTVPERHVIRAVAFDRAGRELARDERVANEGGETFWLRLSEPVEGPASGRVRVALNLRAPAARRVQRVTISWNDAERAVLHAPPWETTISIPQFQLGVLRAFAELDDGRTSEDAVLLNAYGAAGHADVQLVELPIAILGDTRAMTPERITVREGKTVRAVESIAKADETPLTVGLLLDISDSMYATLPDLQEAALRFLDAILGDRDRAFLITFDTRARLIEPATRDRARLRREIMATRPDGLTSLYDAMVLGMLQFEGIQGRRAMVVFTDGRDITSRYRASDVAELARRVNVPIHVITGVEGTHDLGAIARATDLDGVAHATGGTAHMLQSFDQLPGVYAQIEAALRAQVLAFIRTDPATRENEWRAIQVTVDASGAEVHAPAGYYARW